MSGDKTGGDALNNIDRRLSNIEIGILDLRREVAESGRTAWFHFYSAIGFAALGIGSGMGLVASDRLIVWFSLRQWAIIIVSKSMGQIRLDSKIELKIVLYLEVWHKYSKSREFTVQAVNMHPRESQ